jgi:hypothetical protein
VTELRGEVAAVKGVAEPRHPLNARNAERSWGAPATGRDTVVVVKTTEPTVARGDDENAADGNPVPPAKRATRPASLNFGWNSCRFIATRFQ